MKLHVGAGNKYWPGFVNIDVSGDQDIICDIRSLMVDAGCATEIHAIHCFEHIGRMDVDDMLENWRASLAPGGTLVIEVPCLDKIAAMICAGECNQALTLFGLFGDPRYGDDLMLHRWCWSAAEITEVLKSHGFSVEIAEPLFHVPQRDMRVTAIKQETRQ